MAVVVGRKGHRGRLIGRKTCLGVSAAASLMLPLQALAHGSEGGIILLLPTGYYVLGSAFVVAMTFLLISLLPDRLSVLLHRLEWKSLAVRLPRAEWLSLATFCLLALMVAAGFTGTRDPLENPLPAFIWTVWWVCFTLAQAVVGPLWKALNPWSGLLWLLRGSTRSRLGLERRFRLSHRLGYAIAILQFYALPGSNLWICLPAIPPVLRLPWQSISSPTWSG